LTTAARRRKHLEATHAPRTEISQSTTQSPLSTSLRMTVSLTQCHTPGGSTCAGCGAARKKSRHKIAISHKWVPVNIFLHQMSLARSAHNCSQVSCYLRQGGNVFIGVCLFVRRITTQSRIRGLGLLVRILSLS